MAITIITTVATAVTGVGVPVLAKYIRSLSLAMASARHGAVLPPPRGIGGSASFYRPRRASKRKNERMSERASERASISIRLSRPVT